MGTSAQPAWLGPVSGGDIHRCSTLTCGDRLLFVKRNLAEAAAVFAAEHRALRLLRDSGVIRVPGPLFHGHDERESWLVLEHLDLRARGDAAALGAALARLHRVEGPAFGLGSDNFIGATPQPNGWHEDWAGFFLDRRISHQLRLAELRGLPARIRRLSERLEGGWSHLFEGHIPAPSLLHGDLWSGNHGYLPDGQAVVFDPASYYGDRETDIAMCELFGGFHPDVHAAYREEYPLPGDYRRRRPVYQLYHVLNHYNLFGGGWLERAGRLMQEALHNT